MGLNRPLHLRGAVDGLAADCRRAVGALVRSQRVRLELTQQELGERLGMNKTAVSNIELGQKPLAAEHYEDLFIGVFGLDRVKVAAFLLRHSNPYLHQFTHGPGSAPELDFMTPPLPARPAAERARVDAVAKERARSREMAIRKACQETRYRVVRVPGRCLKK